MFSQVSNPDNFSGKVQTIIPHSPNAASLAKFVETPVSLYTGTPIINIPICEVKGRQLSVPISLSYHGGGVMVDDEAGFVGMNWALNAGGAIIRYMHGRPDELEGIGYLDLGENIPSDVNSTTYALWKPDCEMAHYLAN